MFANFAECCYKNNIYQNFARINLANVFLFFVFGRRRLKKRSEKTEIARPKRKHRKRKGKGQASEKIRSPLHLA